MERINCCVLALVAFLGNIVQLVFFFGYSLRLKEKSIKLEKQELNHLQRIKELEKKNGHEQHQINELKEEIRKLKEKK